MWGTDHHGSICKPKDRQDEKVLDIPTRVENLAEYLAESTDVSEIQQVVCGPTDTAIVLQNGTCYVAGDNKFGQLGVGHTQPVSKLTALPVRVQSISLGVHTAGLITKEGDLYTAGLGSSLSSGTGFLGQGEGNSSLQFHRVDSLVEDGCYAKQVQMSEYHTTVLTTEGEVLSCGAGSYGRLGNLETNDQLYLEPVELLTQGVLAIAGGKGFTLALMEDGVLYAWGRNHKGQLGLGFGLAVDMYAMQSVPEPIQADELLGRRVVKMAAGHSHAACVTESGELFYWGMSLYLEPVRMDSLLHTRIVDVACGQDYTLAVDEDGKLYSFGQGQTLTSKRGVLGLGSVGRADQAVWVEALDGKKVTQVSAGWSHAACLVEDA
jgi:alpha-tubulin suppressor-like RCC1 family protein